ncbi:ABC transporter permease [Pseudoruegeria sp. HB172150]|uniref:ABC transporter permease n=1 Tax=Pseudoruegeria sp. HB172150 TaxID=2721164 RepID=UPI001555D2B1|nr:ABC transporter permease [Pseudoruegeria sp. HB172150]
MTDTPVTSSRTSLRAWLEAPAASTPRQARAQAAWRGWKRLLANRAALAGLIVLILLVVIAAIGPLLTPYSPMSQDLSVRLQPPSMLHPLGTDDLGRDIMTRILYGARITLMMALLVALIAGPIGLIMGATAGYLGGWFDIVAMRLVDIFLSFPSLILALAFVAALGPGIENAVIAIALSAWPPIARLARAEALTVRKSDYIAASRLQGASSTRLILRHVMPICLPSVVIRITLNMAGIILTAAGLGFLGLGAQPPSPEWGAMLASGRQFMLTNWWLAATPGAAIMLVSLAFNLLGDGLRDVLDPRDE